MLRHGHQHEDVVGGQIGREEALHLQADLQARPALFGDEDDRFEGQADALGASVAHELELAVGGHKGDDLLGLESAQVDAGVEGHVLQLVIEAQLYVGHARQEALDHHAALHVAAQHAALRADQHVDRLDRVQEDLVLLVLDPVLAPAHLARHLIHC